MKDKPFTFKEFKSIYSRVPRLTVELVVQTKNGIVLTKRSIVPCKGQWHIPGVTLLKGERLEQAMKRVAKKELGLKVGRAEIIGVKEDILKGYFSQPIAVVFMTKVANPKINPDEDADEVGVFKTIPKNTIKSQKEFLVAKLGLKTSQRNF